jgi:hypothetical protein
MIKLLINDVAADLTGVNKIALTKQIAEIIDVENKRSNLSNTIELPHSEINNAIFYNSNTVNYSGSNPRIFFNVTMIQDYVEIITYGKGKLMGSSNGKYQFVVYWGNISLPDILLDKTINDLNLSDLDETWNLTNAKNWTVPGTSYKLAYMLAETHATESLNSGTISNPINVKRLVPFVALSRILRQIEIDNGINFSGECMRKFIDIDSGTYDGVVVNNIDADLWIPVSKKIDAPIEDYEYKREKTYDLYSTTIVDNGTFNSGFGYIPNEDDSNAFTYTFTQTSIYNISTLLSFISHNVRYETLMLNRPDISLLVTFVAEYYEASTGLWTVDSNPIIKGKTIENMKWNDNPFDYSIAFATERLFEAGDKIRFKIKTEIEITGGTPIDAHFYTRCYAYLKKDSQINIVPTNSSFGNTFFIAKNLPEIKQIDIIKYVMALECMVMDFNDVDNTFIFRTFNDICDDISTAVDYTDNLQSFEIGSIHSELSKLNDFDYDNSEDVGTDAGHNTYSPADECLTGTSQAYKAPFSASLNVIYGNSKVAKLPIFENSLDSGTDLVDYTKDFKNIKPRILSCYYDPTVRYYTDGNNNDTNNGKYIAIFGSQIDFKFVLASAYSKWITTFNNYQLINAKMKFSVSEFADIDLLKAAYFKQLGNYFIINKVSNWVAGQLTDVELIKIS